MFHISEEEQRLVSLAECTFQSQKTEEIHLAAKQFKRFMVLKYPNSFSQLQELITKKNILPLNTRKALINLYKASSEWILQILETQAFLNNQSLSSHKKLLHTIEHAFDNSKIESEIKHPIELTYIDVFVFFNAENHERLIAKSKYYFNIKEELLALSLLEMYHSSKSPFKHKVEYYPACLLTLCNYLEKKLDRLYNSSSEQDLDDTFSINLSRHMAVLHEIWTSLDFEIHQTTFIGIFNQDNFVKIWQQLCGNRFPHPLFHYVLDLAEHIIWSLIRCKLLPRYRTLVQLFRQLGLRELNSLMETDRLNVSLTGEEEKFRIAQLKYLITCFDCSFSQPLLQINVTIFDVFSRLAYPNFKLIRAYLDKHSNNLDQIDSFLEDLSFGMRSECVEVLTHKLIISLCESSGDMLKGARVMISTFLFKHLPMISQGEIQDMKTTYILSTSVDLLSASRAFWTTINSQMTQKDQILWMFLFTAIGADLFMTDMHFLSDLNRFMGANSDFLWKKDPEITFYSLLIYKNYKDDIFSDEKTSRFKMNLINCALQNSDQSLIRQFSIIILKEQFDSKPPYDTVFLTVQHIFHSLVQQFISDLLPLVHIIFKHYKSQIAKLKSTIPLFGTIFHLLEQSIRAGRSASHTQQYFSNLELFLEIPEYSPHFSSLILNTVTLAQSLHPKSCEFAQQFLSFLSKGLIIVGSLPPTTEEILRQFSISLHSIQIVNNLTLLIRYTENVSFVNWLLKELISRQFSIESCLLLHSLIYYQGDKAAMQILDELVQKIYRYRVEHRVGVNYVTGKVNLVLLLLIRKNRSLVHWIMRQDKWTGLQASIHQELKVQFQFSSKQIYGNGPVYREDSDQTYISHNHHNLLFMDAIYDLLYVDEHVYCWKYDIEVFLVNQIQLLLTEFQEEQQLRYANVSMVAVLKNVIRAHQFIVNCEEEEEQSQDEQIFQGKQFDRQSILHRDICNQYNRPEEFKQDYLFLFKQLIQKLKSTEASQAWLTTIVQSIFSRDEKQNLQEILNSSFCGGEKIRTVLRVKGLLVDKEPYITDSII